MKLLTADEPPPFLVERARGASPFVLVCEHAARRIPGRLGDLGLDAPDLARHIAWDIGALAVARKLSAHLDATLISQTYSRLVIDCNRQTHSAAAIVEISEETEIPGNRGLSAAEIDARIDEIHRPYQDCVAAVLDSRDAPILIDLHSFTPVFKGLSRPWHVGLLHGPDDRAFSDIIYDLAGGGGGLVVGDSEPYATDMDDDYTIPIHGCARGIVNVEFEIRQDLITEEAGQGEWAARLEGWLTAALARLSITP